MFEWAANTYIGQKYRWISAMIEFISCVGYLNLVNEILYM